MQTPNAFIGKVEQPTPQEVHAVLGPSAKFWDELVEWVAKEHGVNGEVWKSYSPKYGWSLQLKLKKRTIVHLSPCKSSFRVLFIFGDRAVKAALTSHLPKSVARLIQNAPRYPEGTGVQLEIKKAVNLAAIRKLVEVKLAN